MVAREGDLLHLHPARDELRLRHLVRRIPPAAGARRGQGDAAYQQLLAWSATAPILLLNIVSLLFVIFHTVTFFDAAPQAMVVKVGPTSVPGSLVLAGHYAGWVAASAVVCWLLLWV